MGAGSHVRGFKGFVYMPAAALAFHTLIVEDDPSSSEFVHRALLKHGMDAAVAGTVGEALLSVEQEWPNAVVLDLRLPDADGTVLLRRLRRDRRKCRIAIVTGMADLSAYIDLMHFPPDLLLQKPANLGKLVRWLEYTRKEYEADAAGGGSGGIPSSSSDN